MSGGGWSGAGWLVAVGCVASLAAAAELYVAPGGNDGWSGRQADPGAGGQGPYASLARAREEVRRLRRERPAEPVAVSLRGGRYELFEPLTLGAEDSGTATAPVVWRGYRDERPTLTGTRRVEGLAPWRDGILRAELSGTPLAGIGFRQLFYGGERMTLARYPNVAPADPHFGAWAHVLAADDAKKDRFIATRDVVKDWSRLEQAEVCIHPSYGWAWLVVPLKSADRRTGEVVLARGTHYGQRVGDRYYVQGLLEELDAPGEWYLDRAAGTLYFRPPDGDGAEVRAPVTPSVVVMDGARHVTVRGLRLDGCDGDAARIVNSEDCRVAGCVIRNSGGWGAVVAGGRRAGVVGCDIDATGSGGVSLDGGDDRTLEPAGNYASNNYIHHIAAFQRTYKTGVNLYGVGNLASHNLIHDCYHQGILLGGNDNVVEYNVVHHTNLGSEDTGGLYMSSRNYLRRGNVVRYNVFHHVGGFGKVNSWSPVRDGRVEFEYPHFTWGIYLDAPETGVHVYGNVLYDLPTCGLFNHSGKDNLWENNIIVDAPAFRASVWGQDDLFETSWNHVRKARTDGYLDPYLERYPDLRAYDEAEPRKNAMFHCRFVRNIVYYTESGGAWLRERNAKSWDGGQLVWSYRGHRDDFAGFEFDHNLIWAPEGVTPRFELHLFPDPGRLVTWDEWRATGQDQHSRLADPLFEDPARHDYRLKPGSPATDLGFKPIPFEQIGPQPDELRASWPIVEAPGASRLGNFTTQRAFQLPGLEPVEAAETRVRGGLPRLAGKLAAGQPVTLVCFAGGNHAQGRWFEPFAEALRQRSPGQEIKAVTAAIDGGARGSGFSIHRFAHEALRHRPDLIVFDFAADDTEAQQESLMAVAEGLVRQAWRADPATDLLFVYAFKPGMEPYYEKGLCPSSVTAWERVAEHYGVPAINFGCRVAALARDGRLLLKATAEEAKAQGRPVFTTDGVYASADAWRIYTETAGERFGEVLKGEAVDRQAALATPLRPNHLERATQMPITASMVSGQWEQREPGAFAQHFPTLWYTASPGATLTFKFKGTACSLFSLMGPDTGRAQVLVDGRDTGVREQVDRWCYYHRVSALHLASGLDDAEHTITVRLLPDPPNRQAPIDEAKRLGRYDAKAFEGVTFRFGSIRIVGEPPD